MSPARRLLLTAAALVLGVVLLVAVAARLLGEDAVREVPAAQDVPGPVLLVPGYGGATGALEVLATALRTSGRTATVLPLPGDGTGDLRASAAVVATAVDAALVGGAPSVDLVGYSAGGVVVRLVADERPSAVRRAVTLGSPHHGTRVAALGAAFVPGSCPEACRQLAPGSDLLDGLEDTPDGPQWLSLWTVQDEIVTPPETSRLDGAANVALQDLCPGARVTHGDLPRVRVVHGLVRAALSGPVLGLPPDCATAEAAGA